MTDPLSDFLRAACVPRDGGHASGTLDEAAALLAAHPDIATSSIHAAAVLGDDVSVRRFIGLDRNQATAKGGPHGWDALTHLCFSRYLRLDPARSDGFVRAATALLDAGASSNTGWFENNHQPKPEWESALYGAAGVAHHAGLTRLLIERGAEPNDAETPYHVPESYDNGALTVLVDSGKMTADSLATMLLRKADWHDVEGMKILLDRGADPNRMTQWHYTALHQGLRRDNALANIDLLLERGADAALPNRLDGASAVAIAARRGRGDVLELFVRRGVAIDLRGVERLTAACAMNDTAAVRSITTSEPNLVGELLAQGGSRLAEFSGNGNTDGARQLLDLGVPVTALHAEGDDYFGIAKNSTALHVAAWLLRPDTVRLLLDRGAAVNAADGSGRTALALAVRACVDSYWTRRRSPALVDALLRAGASVHGVMFPSGYAEVDGLLRPYIRPA